MEYNQRHRSVDLSASNLCQYQQWWDRRRQRASHNRQLDVEHGVINLPLPVFPPALDFHPKDFALPPPYAEVVDFEKAIHPSSSRHSISSDGSTLCTFSTSPEPLLSKPTLKQEEPRSKPRLPIRIIRHVRYTVFTVYRRLFTFIFVLNLLGIFILLAHHGYHDAKKTLDLDHLATFASSNFLLAIFIRQDYIVNLLFRAAWLVPWSVPLRMRRIVARVYCYGGIHSGAAVAGTLWWVVFTVALSWTFVREGTYALLMIIVAWAITMLLMTILLLAFPSIRARYHDTFELTHRFLGWTSIFLFWIQLFLLIHYTSRSSTTNNTMSALLVRSPTFWNLAIMTILLIYPWLRLRRWTFTVHPLSSHAVRLSFPNKVHKFSCLSISSSPLSEWHPFASFPSTDPANPGASMVISSAGDWTNNIIRSAYSRTIDYGNEKKQITSSAPPHEIHFWVKPHPKAGVLSLSCLFSRIIILTTGSGIGPSLSSLLDRPAAQFARLIWSTRSPLRTYGAHMLSLVYKADPNALVLDTDEMGRPNLLDVVWRMFLREECEAVFVLSNIAVTKRVVGGLEKRGIPAFGPIWDS